MPYGPFASAAAYHRWAKEREAGEDPRFFVLRDRATGHCGGIASYLRIDARSRLDRGRPYLHRPRDAEGRGGDRGDVADDGLGLPRRLSPL
jgi:hypothetical protein